MNRDVVAESSNAVQSLKDPGKSDMEPESEAALKEIVKWLQTQPGIELEVVERTDKVGAVD